MSESIRHKARSLHPGTRASIYYMMVWGATSLYATYMSIDFIQRGLTETQWGVISALRALTVFLVAPQITRLADRSRSRVKTLRRLLILSAFVLLSFLIPASLPGLLIFSIIHAMSSASIQPMGDGIVVRMARKHDLEYGRLRLWGSLGFALFGTLIGLLWGQIGYSSIYIAGFIGLMVVAYLTRMLEEPEDEVAIEEPTEAVVPSQTSGEVPGERKKIFALLLGDVVLLLFFLAALFRACSELMFFSFSGIYVDALTNSGFFAGLINNGAAILEIPVMLFSQRIIRKFNLQSVIVFGFVIQMLGTGLFAFTTNPWLMFVGSALRNAGFAFYFVAAVQFVDQRAARGYATTYQGFLSSISWGLAPLIVSPLGGLIYESWGAQWVFIIGTILSGISVAIMIPVLIKLRVEKHTQQSA